MYLQTAKEILTLVPESAELLKTASVEGHAQALHEPANALASYLDITYLEKVAGKAVDIDYRSQTLRAVSLLGLTKQAEEFSASLVERATQPKLDLEKEASRRVHLVKEQMNKFDADLVKAASLANYLVDSKYGETEAVKNSPEVAAMACTGYMDKAAAISELYYRFNKSGYEPFIKLANVINERDTVSLTRSEQNAICDAVRIMEKTAKLACGATNFNRHVMVVRPLEKAAFEKAICCTVAGRSIPLDKIQQVGHGTLASVLGEEVAQALQGHPVEAEAVIDTLPLDSQQLLEALVR